MFKLDNDLLVKLGLGDVAPDLKNLVLATMYEHMELTVGYRLASRMTNEQLDEFEGFIDANDEAGALKWLESNFPEYKAVVADALEDLQAEIRRDLTEVRTLLGRHQPRVPQSDSDDPVETPVNGDEAQAFSDSTGIPRPVAVRLLERFGSSDAIAAAPDDDLLCVIGVGPARLAIIRSAPQLPLSLDPESR
jgi:hypothetical protein